MDSSPQKMKFRVFLYLPLQHKVILKNIGHQTVLVTCEFYL